MNAPEWLKLVYASCPIPGIKRIVVASHAASTFSGGIRSMIIQGARHWHQCYCLPSFSHRQELQISFAELSIQVAKSELELIPKNSIIYPVCIELECLPNEIKLHDPQHLLVVSKWIAFYKETYRHALKIVQQVRPKAIIYFQGYMPESAILREIAIKLDIPYVAVENSAFYSRVTWDHISGYAVTKNLAKNYFWKMDGVAPKSEIDDFREQYLSSIRTSKKSDHSSPSHNYEFPPRKKSRLRILILGQVFTDASIIFGLRNDLTPVSIINRAIEFSTKEGHQTVIKLHPKEKAGLSPLSTRYNSLTFRKLQQHCKSLNEAVVDVDNAWDTYDLIRQSDIIITHSSQAGLEAAIMGKPVFLCGEAFYRDLGFTIDADSCSDLESKLRQFDISAWPKSISTEKAARFFYIFCRNYCIEPSPAALFRLLRTKIY